VESALLHRRRRWIQELANRQIVTTRNRRSRASRSRITATTQPARIAAAPALRMSNGNAAGTSCVWLKDASPSTAAAWCPQVGHATPRMMCRMSAGPPSTRGEMIKRRRRHASSTLASDTDEQDCMPGRVAFVPFNLVIGNGTLVPFE